MAVIASNQQTIVDLTDAYNVILTSEAHTFQGTASGAKAGSCKTQVVALRGSEQVPCAVGSVTCPTGVTATSDGDATAPTLTISATTALEDAGEVVIPVTINGDITITKRFSVSVALTGAQGAQGPAGADAVTMSVTSSNGFIFKNADVVTTLTAHVFRAGTELTTSQVAALGTVRWYKDGGKTAVATGLTLSIGAGDVTDRASYTAQLEG